MITRLVATLLSLCGLLLAGHALAAAPTLLAHQAPLVLNEASSAWILIARLKPRQLRNHLFFSIFDHDEIPGR